MVNKSTKFWVDYVSQNEINLVSHPGQNDLFTKNIYNSFNYFTQYQANPSRNVSITIKNKNRKNHGPIYDLCFSPDGRLLVAGTEENALLIFDSLNHQLINQVDDAHENSINNIKFLDSNFFATGSNDRKIGIWDIRKLNHANHRLKLLEGHSHFVKNLEYDANLRYLVSSGFDGSVFIWDIYNDDSSFDQLESGFIRTPNCMAKKILSVNCLMRMRLTYDNAKMIISTVEGYIMIIHDLDLTTLKEDLNEFQSDLYRLMQKKHSSGFDFGSWQNSLFKSKRNRVELISDFPVDNEAHVIGSLDVHPDGWCILSRNLSRDENSEWTCVHNIQDYEQPNEMMFIEVPKTDNIYFPHAVFKNNSTNIDPVINMGQSDHESVAPHSPEAITNEQTISINESVPDDLHISPLIIISARSSARRGAQATLLNPNTSYRKIKPGSNPKIFCNLNRMTHYIEESNEHKLFFKESHFSRCGRFIASPHNENPNFGFRLLSFNSECSELSDQMLDSNFHPPHPLNVFKIHFNHSNYVTTVNFSPTHHLIVSGCLDGLVGFYQPII